MLDPVNLPIYSNEHNALVDSPCFLQRRRQTRTSIPNPIILSAGCCGNRGAANDPWPSSSGIMTFTNRLLLTVFLDGWRAEQIVQWGMSS